MALPECRVIQATCIRCVYAKAGNNAEGVDRLIRARVDPGGKAAASLTPFMAPWIENAGMQKRG